MKKWQPQVGVYVFIGCGQVEFRCMSSECCSGNLSEMGKIKLLYKPDVGNLDSSLTEKLSL